MGDPSPDEFEPSHAAAAADRERGGSAPEPPGSWREGLEEEKSDRESPESV